MQDSDTGIDTIFNASTHRVSQYQMHLLKQHYIHTLIFESKSQIIELALE